MSLLRSYKTNVELETSGSFKQHQLPDSFGNAKNRLYFQGEMVSLGLEKRLHENRDNRVETERLMASIQWDKQEVVSDYVIEEGFLQLDPSNIFTVPPLIAVLRSGNDHAINNVPEEAFKYQHNRSFSISFSLWRINDIQSIQKIAGKTSVEEASLKNAAQRFLVSIDDPQHPLLPFWLNQLKPVAMGTDKAPSSPLTPILHYMSPKVIEGVCERAILDHHTLTLVVPALRSLLRNGYFKEFSETLVHAFHAMEKDDLVRQLNCKSIDTGMYAEIMSAHAFVLAGNSGKLPQYWDDLMGIMSDLTMAGSINCFANIVQKDWTKMGNQYYNPGAVANACCALKFDVDIESIFEAVTKVNQNPLFRQPKHFKGFLNGCLKEMLRQVANNSEEIERAWALSAENRDEKETLRNLMGMWSKLIEKGDFTQEFICDTLKELVGSDFGGNSISQNAQGNSYRLITQEQTLKQKVREKQVAAWERIGPPLNEMFMEYILDKNLIPSESKKPLLKSDRF